MDSYSRLLKLKKNCNIKNHKNNVNASYDSYKALSFVRRNNHFLNNSCCHTNINDDSSDDDDELNDFIFMDNMTFLFGNYFYYSYDNINWTNVSYLNNTTCGTVHNGVLYAGCNKNYYSYDIIYTDDMINFNTITTNLINSNIKNIFVFQNKIFILSNDLILINYNNSSYHTSIIEVDVSYALYNNYSNALYYIHKQNSNKIYLNYVYFDDNSITNNIIDTKINIDNNISSVFYFNMFNYETSTNQNNNHPYTYIFNNIYVYETTNIHDLYYILNTNISQNPIDFNKGEITLKYEINFENCIGIEYNNNEYITVGYGNTNNYMISSNGQDWTNKGLFDNEIYGNITPYKTFNYNNIIYLISSSGIYKLLYYINSEWNILTIPDNANLEYVYIYNS